MRRLAEKIFDSLAAGSELTRHQRMLLSAAALLHDIGYHIAHGSHHKHALYLIKNSELTGFSEGERAVIANIARYHRGPAPKERHPDFAALNPADRDSVCRLGAILRLADGLDRNHENRVRDLDCTIEGDVVHIHLESDGDCAKELDETERRRPVFEQAFNCTLNVSRQRAKATSA